MNTGDRSDLVKQIAAEIGFDRCGIAPAAPIPRGDYLRRWLAEGRAGTMGYLHRHVESRIDVRAWLPSANSVIVVALNYHQPEPTVTANPCFASESSASADPPRGRVAMYAWGEDYHVVVREKLEQLVSHLRERIAEPFEAKICVDTSAIIEREWAVMAGIGWIGKNTMVLDASLGSYFFLGELITDLELAPDTPQTDHCGTCTRCLEACPTQAFPRPYEMDARRCISYLTIEHRGEIEPELASKLGDWVFGCDVCQQVCPYNKDAPMTGEPRFAVNEADASRPALSDIAEWDDAAYRAYTNGKATDRAKLEMWKRNARLAGR